MSDEERTPLLAGRVYRVWEDGHTTEVVCLATTERSGGRALFYGVDGGLVQVSQVAEDHRFVLLDEEAAVSGELLARLEDLSIDADATDDEIDNIRKRIHELEEANERLLDDFVAHQRIVDETIQAALKQLAE